MDGVRHFKRTVRLETDTRHLTPVLTHNKNEFIPSAAKIFDREEFRCKPETSVGGFDAFGFRFLRQSGFRTTDRLDIEHRSVSQYLSGNILQPLDIALLRIGICKQVRILLIRLRNIPSEDLVKPIVVMSFLNLDVIDERLRRRPRKVDFGRRPVDEFSGEAVAVAHALESVGTVAITEYCTFL